MLADVEGRTQAFQALPSVLIRHRRTRCRRSRDDETSAPPRTFLRGPLKGWSIGLPNPLAEALLLWLQSPSREGAVG